MKRNARCTFRALAYLVALGIAAVLLSAASRPVNGDTPVPVCEVAPCHSYAPVITTSEWGGSWEPVGKGVAENVEKFYSVAACGDHVLAGSDLGVYSLKRPSSDWVRDQPAITGAPTEVTFVLGDCTIAYSASRGFGVWRGDYDEETGWGWVRVDKDSQLASARSVVIVSAVVGSQPTIYVAGDFGVKWLPSLPITAQTWQPTNLNTLTVSLTADAGVLASVWQGGIYQRTGDGVWSLLGSDNTPSDKSIYQAVYDGSKGVAGTQSGAFYWDNGKWQPAESIKQTTFSVALSRLGLFAGKRTEGVVASVDDGKTWLPLKAGMIGVGSLDFQIRDLFVVPDSNGQCLLAAATNGIWQWGTCP